MKTFHLCVRYAMTHPSIPKNRRVHAIIILLGHCMADENFTQKLIEDAGA